MEFVLFYFFSLVLLLSSFGVICISNVVYSAFFLVLCFFNGACLIFLLGVDFIGFLILLIYVGAISVLFLFVIIMLNLKVFYDKFNSKLLFKGVVVVFLCLFICFTFIVVECFYFFNYFALDFTFEIPPSLEWVLCIDFISNLSGFSQMLYTYYFYYILLVGFILLISMVGSVWLVFTTTNTISTKKGFFKVQQIYNQLSRDVSSSVILVKCSVVSSKLNKK